MFLCHCSVLISTHALEGNHSIGVKSLQKFLKHDVDTPEFKKLRDAL